MKLDLEKLDLQKYENFNVIIIDDEIHSSSPQKLMLHSLHKMKMKAVYTYFSGPEFFSQFSDEIQTLSSCFYLVDYHLKNGEIGVDIIKKIRAQEQALGLFPAYICGWTSDSAEEREGEFKEAGADQYLAKAYNRHELEKALAAASVLFQHHEAPSTATTDLDSPIQSNYTCSSSRSSTFSQDSPAVSPKMKGQFSDLSFSVEFFKMCQTKLLGENEHLTSASQNSPE